MDVDDDEKETYERYERNDEVNSDYDERPLIAYASRSRAGDSDDEEFSDI